MGINSIGGPNGTGTTGSHKTTANQSADPAQKSTQPDSATDSVKVSEPSLKLIELEQTIANLPSFDAAKVDNIKQAMREGSYTIIDAMGLAEKIRNYEQDLP